MTGLFKKLENKVIGSAPFYKMVYDMRSELKKAMDAKSPSALPKDLLNVAIQFHARIDNALTTYENKKTDTVPDATDALMLLANTTITAIYDYQPALISAPGILNQFKAHVNNILQYFNISPLFNTEWNDLGLKSDFKTKYDLVNEQIKGWRDKAEQQALTECAEFFTSCCNP